MPSNDQPAAQSQGSAAKPENDRGDFKSAAQTYEYGIGAGEAQAMTLHRSDMTEDEAETWMVEWVQMTGRRAPFRIIRRPVGEWEDV